MKEKLEETKILELTISNMQQEIGKTQQKTFDEKNLERLENENDLLSRQVNLTVFCATFK